MRSVGIPAVRPLAYGESRRLGLLRSCALVTEGIAEDETLVRLLRGDPTDAEASDVIRARQRLTRALAEQVRAMHQLGYTHGALFWRNIVIRRLEDGSYACHFLDPSGGGRMWRRRFAGRRAVRDIAALAAMAPGVLTRAERLRFAKWYLATDRLDAAARRWIQRVLRLSMRYQGHEMYRWRLEVHPDGCEEGASPAGFGPEVVTGRFAR